MTYGCALHGVAATAPREVNSVLNNCIEWMSLECSRFESMFIVLHVGAGRNVGAARHDALCWLHRSHHVSGQPASDSLWLDFSAKLQFSSQLEI